VRRHVRHGQLLAALDELAETAEHRLDADGADIGSAAARLRLRHRAMSPSWRWAELADLGIDTAAHCVESTVSRVVVYDAAGNSVAAARVPD